MTLLVRGQFWVNEGVLEPGGSTETHEHTFDHITYVLGPARVEALDGPGGNVTRYIERPKGGWVVVTANTWHRITNIGQDMLQYHCLFVPRHPISGAIEADMNGWHGAYG